MAAINGRSVIQLRGRPMLIVCPACVSTYRIDPAVIGEAGNSVRCAHCRQPWVVAPPSRQGTVAAPADDRKASVHDASMGQAPFRALGDAVSLGVRPQPSGPRRTQAAEPAERSAAGVMVLAVGCLALAMAGIAWRETIARTAPAMASIFQTMGLATAADGLTLQSVRSDLDDTGPSKFLVVEGEIRNDRSQALTIPNLRIVVRDRAEQSVYSWTSRPPKAALAPGETVAFQSRVVAPPDEGHDLTVSFADARGAVMVTGVEGQHE